MSREERRQRERMMKNMERGAALPPAARLRAERNAARRAARSGPAQRPGGFTRRFMIVTLLVAVALGYIAFSIAYQQPQAPLIGIGLTVLVLVVLVGIRLLQRRATARRP